MDNELATNNNFERFDCRPEYSHDRCEFISTFSIRRWRYYRALKSPKHGFYYRCRIPIIRLGITELYLERGKKNRETNWKVLLYSDVFYE